MAPATPTGEPTDLIIGDSWRWRIADHPDYPNSESWTLAYDFVGVGILLATDITVAFRTSGDDVDHWLVTVTTAKTAVIDDGRYDLFKRFIGSGDHAGQSVTIGRDGKVAGPPLSVTIREDPRVATAGMFQTHAERTLVVIEAALEGRLTKDLESYQIAGRSISKIPVETLMKMRGRYASLVKQERTGRLTRRHLIRFPAHA